MSSKRRFLNRLFYLFPISKRAVIKDYYHCVEKEKRIRNFERERFYHEAQTRFKDEKPVHGSLKEYKRYLYRHRFTYEEYMYRYKLWSLTRKQRKDVISCWEMNCIYRKLAHPSVRTIFADKSLILDIYKQFVNRRWLKTKCATYDAFSRMVSSSDCIFKPLYGECGNGILKTSKCSEQDCRSLFDKYKDQDYLVEECIYECKELEDFHPASLNTIRVVTMQNGKDFVIIGAALRMGNNNSIVDNIGSGGISAPINIDSGKITVKGRNEKSDEYEAHPTSGKRIVGFVVPYWAEVIRFCEEAAFVVPGTFIVGWDICVLASGKIELIEANALPDIIAIQYLPGFSMKKVIKEAGNSLFGFNLLSLESVLQPAKLKWCFKSY